MIYVHIPFCHRKCTYCAFYSVVTSASKEAYMDALCLELERRRSEQAHAVRTLYVGGGTPTVLSIAQLQRMADTLRRCYDLSQLQEATIEANPEDLTPTYVEALHGLGLFNRVSIGVQSFSDYDLRRLNRRHTAQQAEEAVRNAAAAGFANISIDLIYGLPGQTLEGWRRNLSLAAALPVSHLSAYSLTVEEGTMLQRQIASGRVQPPSEEDALSHYHALVEWSKRQGFAQYEISNFCHPGCHSRHNSRYWDRTPYLGVGAAAHSFDGHSRRWNVAHATQYIDSTLHGLTAHESETLTPTDAYNEYVMTALRTVQGIAKACVAPRYAEHLRQAARGLVASGLLEETATHYCPTAEGLLRADGMAVELMADPSLC